MIREIPKEKEFLLKVHTLETMLHRKDAHRHNFYTLIYVSSGSGSQYIDYEQTTVKPHSIYFLAPQKVHLLQADCEGYAIMFSAEHLNKDDKMIDTLFMGFKNETSISLNNDDENTINMIIDLINQSHQTSHISVSYRYTLLSAFLHYCLDIKEKNISHHESLLNQRFIQIKALIEKHYKEHKPMTFYTDYLSLTTQHFNRLLKEHTGKTLANLIHDRRILEAKRELVFTDDTVDKIGESLGFYDSSNFSKYFKKYTGYAPSIFRKIFKSYQ